MPFGFVTCGPNEALVISGCFYDQPAMIPGGRAFVFPAIQRADRISLNVMTLIIESPRIYTKLGVPITVTGVAQVKIQGSNSEMLAAACEQFLGKTEFEIQEVAKETLEGHQRAIMGNMTVEEIYKDRQKFSQAVFDVASSDLVNMGISVVSYTLKDIKDEQGYLHALGMARTAQVKRDARIGEAEAKKESGIKAAIAVQEREQAKLLNDAEIALAQRDYELKKASFDQEVAANKATSNLAYEIQAAKTKQLIMEEEMQIKVIERKKQIDVEGLEIERVKKNLLATVNKKAEAERYQMQMIAEANKRKIIAEAEAEAQAIRLKGLAEAESLEAKAKAEAEQMEKKAIAWKEYKGAANLEMVLKALPKIAAEVSAPLASCKKVTMVNSGDGEVGVSKLTGEVLDIVNKLPTMIESLTGVNVFSQDEKLI